MKAIQLENSIGHFQIYQVQSRRIYDSKTGYTIRAVILDGPLAGIHIDFNLNQEELEEYNLE